LLEDSTLCELAEQVVPAEGSGVDNAQVTGLLSTVRASNSYNVLRAMTQKQHEKARKEGDRGQRRADFYSRLFHALKQVETLANDRARADCTATSSTAEQKKHRQRWADRFALVLMTHVAAEHRWRWRRDDP
jgi:hypothetical protein